MDQPGKRGAHVLAGNDDVHQAVLHHELRRLEAGRQISVSGFLHHARTGKTDHALGFGQDHIAQSGEARGHTTGCRVGEHRNVAQARLGVARQGTAGLGHLHQAQDALVHARSTRGGEDDHGLGFLGRDLDGAGDLFAHHAAHAGGEEAEVHDRQHTGLAVNRGPASDDSFIKAGLVLIGLHLFQVAFEAERVLGLKIIIQFIERSFVAEGGDTLRSALGKVVATVRANAQESALH